MTRQKFVLLSVVFAVAGISAVRPVKSAEPRSVRVPPFVWYESDEERRFLMALLLYWSGKEKSGEFDLLAPIYYHTKSGGEEVRVMLPFHYRYVSGRSKSVLWGPYFSQESLRGDRKSTRLNSSH